MAITVIIKLQDNETDGHFSVEHCSEDNPYGERSIPDMAKLIASHLIIHCKAYSLWALDC